MKSYEYARLDAFPELTTQTNLLIEEAFAYQDSHQFSVDFAPLAQPRNANQRHILIDPLTSSVVAHVGTRLKSFVWQGEVIPVIFIGGIAVARAERGQGLFQLLFERVLTSLESQCALFLLWSDKHELYRKWDFHLAGKQWCYRSLLAETLVLPEKLIDLSKEERLGLARLYRQNVNQSFFSPLRDDSDWEDLCQITSAELLRLKAGYAFRNKGMDLQGIIHDYAHPRGVGGLLGDLGNAGVVWAAKNEQVPDDILQDLQQVGLWRPNHHSMALRKLSHLLGWELNFREDHFVVFKENNHLKMNAEDLLDEIFNYSKHGLRSEGIPVYVGGLDSI